MNSKWEADHLKARDAADEANRADHHWTFSYGLCNVEGDEPDEDGYITCSECGYGWPGPDV